MLRIEMLLEHILLRNASLSNAWIWEAFMLIHDISCSIFREVWVLSNSFLFSFWYNFILLIFCHLHNNWYFLWIVGAYYLLFLAIFILRGLVRILAFKVLIPKYLHILLKIITLNILACGFIVSLFTFCIQIW